MTARKLIDHISDIAKLKANEALSISQYQESLDLGCSNQPTIFGPGDHEGYDPALYFGSYFWMPELACLRIKVRKSKRALKYRKLVVRTYCRRDNRGVITKHTPNSTLRSFTVL